MTLTDEYQVSKYEATLRTINECHRQQMETEMQLKAAREEIETLKRERLHIADQVSEIALKLEQMKEWAIGKFKGSKP